ncbi:MAG: hypothetical protein ACQEWU_20725 [Bacillota bacterium]|uniref:Uncharacterized protein n=1 Tax=Virgibacillus salarius TaxID=447199 RepID=A0A941ID69_9BACI|nr:MULTISPECIES: hypothetical protein [Bacillaceae]NAZ10949.1 hypothetical protein [Agaribacter marinus]MBR7798241.1 hypothetical protein [Virgibacillus salarius]MCC2252758.1 hypothetical protein [Virgibacillus sp. AGTR]MDY7044381.1 hypothetical protein [Virgibacillus sp. M23]QRZ19699.1 hypothetical protein JUJ52_08670 [Virgibacillus sp. AGTR]
MLKKVKSLLFIFIFSLIFIVGCGAKDSSDSEKVAKASEEPKAEATIPEDDTLKAVLEENIQTMMDKDLQGHMKTIHPESPGYDTTKELINSLQAYTLDITLTDVHVEEKSAAEARLAYTQTNMKVEGPDYQNNQTTGVHILKPDNGEWKIYSSEIGETVNLDENGEVIEAGEAEPVMEGNYVEEIRSLEMPFSEDKWELGNYAEESGEAIVEFLVSGETFENYTELLTLHYYEDGKDLIGVKNFITNMEGNLSDMIDGELQFEQMDVTNEEGFYEFAITNDSLQYDQEELARVFVKDSDMFVIRYTTMEQKIKQKEAWLEKLKAVK